MMIRKATAMDIPQVEWLIRKGQEQMRSSGNNSQWTNLNRVIELALEDLKRGECYLVEENQEVLATFSLLIGKDPTYEVVEGGQWSKEGEYGTLHRVASSGKKKALGKMIFDWAKEQCDSLRVDTHKDNLPMIKRIKESDFHFVGIIYVEDGTPRLAYEWNKEDE